MLRRPSIAIASLGLTAAACTSETPLEDPLHPTGSQPVAASADRSALFVANVRHGSVSRVRVDTNTVTTTEIGSEPTRIAAVGNRVFVTLRGERRLAVLDGASATPTVEGTVELGHEPYGVVGAEDGQHVFVSVSQQNRVVEVDPTSLEVTRSWDVPGEPKWMALHPNGERLYVASGMQGTLTVVDTTGDGADSQPMPPLWYGGGVRMARITGDPAVAPDGRTVAVPTLHLDNETPIDDTAGRIPPGGYYGGRIGPTVTLVPLEGGEPKYDEATIVNVSQGGDSDGYVAGVTWSPTGEELYLSIEGSASVIAMRFEPDAPPSDGGLFGNIVFGERGADGAPGDSRPLDYRAARFVKTAEGARGVAFVDEDRAYAYGFLSRQVQELPVEGLRNGLSTAANRGLFSPPEPLAASRTPRVEVAPRALPEAIDRGQRLFYSTVTESMTSGSGLSCATCHFDGRTDGLSWTFLRGSFQTPSLAGEVSATEPVRWQGDRATVAIDAQRTSEDAMGGLGLDDPSADDVAAFVDWVRDVDVPKPSVDDPQVVRGRAIFERADVACAACHSGPRLTDNVSYAMFGLDTVQTRSLVGLAASAPYLHDGSAATLRDVVERATEGGMGDTSMLSDAEKDDLVAYLRSL